MRYETRAHNGIQKIPNTHVQSLLQGNLILCVRSWGTEVGIQKIASEVEHYLSSIDADLDLTTPFEYIENLTRLANKSRIALLLANDLILNTENKMSYQEGAEVALFLQSGKELAWATIGRFSIEMIKNSKPSVLFDSGVVFDDLVALPLDLLGTSKNPMIQSGSISIADLDSITVQSQFRFNEINWVCKITQI